MSRKVLLILVDGMRPDALQCSSEAVEAMKNHPHTLCAQTVMPSITLPCHMSLFHSVDPLRHNNLTNTYMPQVRPVKGMFDVFSAAGKRCGSFVNWEELRDLYRPGSVTRFAYYNMHRDGFEKTNEQCTDAAIDFALNGNADCIFLYLGMTDEVGHEHGWMGEEYLESVRSSWRSIMRICNQLSDEWTVIVTADHGGHDRMHGTDMKEDTTIPIFMWGNGVENPDFTNATIKDLAPTIAHLLEVDPDPEWEGHSLL